MGISRPPLCPPLCIAPRLSAKPNCQANRRSDNRNDNRDAKPQHPVELPVYPRAKRAIVFPRLPPLLRNVEEQNAHLPLKPAQNSLIAHRAVRPGRRLFSLSGCSCFGSHSTTPCFYYTLPCQGQGQGQETSGSPLERGLERRLEGGYELGYGALKAGGAVAHNQMAGAVYGDQAGVGDGGAHFVGGV